MILLARHGETDDNVPPLRFQGCRDTPLNATGRAQALQLAERVAEAEPIAALWCSQLSRAHETAETVGRRIGLCPRVDERFAEADRGRWEGHLFDEVKRAEPERFAAFQRPDPDFRFPDGESLREQSDRVLAALVDVRRSGESPALVVCHGGAIRVALCHAHGRGLEAFHEWEVPNGALIRL